MGKYNWVVLEVMRLAGAPFCPPMMFIYLKFSGKFAEISLKEKD